MQLVPGRVQGLMLVAATCLVLGMGFGGPSAGQEKTTQTAGVDNNKMGAYRALAELTLQAFQRGDKATAAELARILEKTWDAAEEHGGETSLAKRNEGLFEQIDHAMDAFIKPIIRYAAMSPKLAAVQVAYNDYLEKLQQGD
jgi:hypothetical protein